MKNVFNELWEGIGMKARYGLFFGIGFICSCIILYITGYAMIGNIPKNGNMDNLVEEAMEIYTGIEGVDLSTHLPEE